MENKNMLSFVIIAMVIIGGVIFLYDKPNPENPGAVDVGTEVPARVDMKGNCVGREGIELGMCCATWDGTKEKEVWTDCEELVDKTPAQTQAFFQFEGANKLSAVSSVMFTVKITNTGNFDTSIVIDSISVNATAGGDAAGISEIRGAFNTLVGVWKPVPKGTSIEYSMNTAKRVRLDIPAGTDAFTMKDGTYTVTLNLRALDDKGNSVAAGTRTVQMGVEQEVIAFNIDVNQI